MWLRRWYHETFEREYWIRVRKLARKEALQAMRLPPLGPQLVAFFAWYVAVGVLQFGYGGWSSAVTTVATWAFPFLAWLTVFIGMFVYYLNRAPAILHREALAQAGEGTSATEPTDPATIISGLSERAIELLTAVPSEGWLAIHSIAHLPRVVEVPGPQGRKFPADYKTNPEVRLAYIDAVEVELLGAGLVFDEKGARLSYQPTRTGWAVIRELTATELREMERQHGALSNSQVAILRALRNFNPARFISMRGAPQTLLDQLQVESGGQQWTTHQLHEQLAQIPDAYRTGGGDSPVKVSPLSHRYLRAKSILMRPQ